MHIFTYNHLYVKISRDSIYRFGDRWLKQKSIKQRNENLCILTRSTVSFLISSKLRPLPAIFSLYLLSRSEAFRRKGNVVYEAAIYRAHEEFQTQTQISTTLSLLSLGICSHSELVGAFESEYIYSISLSPLSLHTRNEWTNEWAGVLWFRSPGHTVRATEARVTLLSTVRLWRISNIPPCHD